ncbi:MAG TPA: ABC transporter permease [Herpetosiphonaceae bacterium]|nr:ABC transporter permease [Herpetosiphonaceae bacterium]
MSNPASPNDQRDPTQTPAEVVQQPTPAPDQAQSQSSRNFSAVLVPLLAILTALIVGAIVVLFTAPPEKGNAFVVTFKAFRGLFVGAFGDWTNPSTIPNALSGTLVESTPYILAGLAVALGFKAGLFNIGAEGQLLMGAIAASAVGVWLPQWVGAESLPAIIHLPLALLAGALAGGLWGAIPGYLRAKTGAHEVINTIMLNYIALRVLDYLIVNGPMRAKGASPQRTPFVQSNADLPRFIGIPSDPSLTEGQSYNPLFTTGSQNWDLRVHTGLLLALLAVAFIWWLLNRTPKGFEIRTVGANPEAARYAGMNITRTFVLTMGLSGALAGLAGTGQVLGLDHNLKSVFSGGLGFDSIAIALLAKSNPIAIVPAAIFWGALRQGAGAMQISSGISINLINIIQALVIIFIAADQIVRWIYRIKKSGGGGMVFSRGWGK